MIGAAEAQVIVLVEDDELGAWCSAADADVSRWPRSTRRARRRGCSVPTAAGSRSATGCAGLGRALVAVSSELVGVCERALAMTVEYVKERKQFGVPVGSYQAVSHRCAQMLLETEKARSTTAFAAWTADAEPERLRRGRGDGQGCASDAGREVTASAIQAHGGIGFTWEADVHWLYKRAQLDAALLGGARHHRARVAALLGADVVLSAAVPT